MENDKGMPWFKFWWGKWHSNAKVQNCTPESKLVLIELIGMMGYNGFFSVKNDPKMIQNSIGIDWKIVRKSIENLQKNDVISINSDGDISVNDIFNATEISSIRRIAGKKGGKRTGDLLKQTSEVLLKQNVTSCILTSPSTSISSNNTSTERSAIGETRTESSDCAVLGSPQPQSGPRGEAVTEKSVAAPPRAEPAPDEAQTRTGTRKARGEALCEFEEWYCKLYPRRQGREDAEKAWIQVTVNAPAHKRASAEEIMEGTRQWIAAGMFAKERQYIPLPSSFLRGYRFRDEIQTQGTTQPVFKVPFAHDDPLVMEQDPIFAAMMQEDN